MTSTYYAHSRLAHLLALIVLFFIGTPSSGQCTFTNPVILNESPDPGVFYDSNTGWYYVYSTFREAFRSKDLVNWEPLGDVLAVPGNKETTWAPHVSRRKKDGLIYMFYTQDTRLYIARAETPEGPFEYHAGPLFDFWSIDSHFFQDETPVTPVAHNHLSTKTTLPPLPVSV